MLTSLAFKMIIAILVGLLMEAVSASIVPHNTAIIFDNDTVLAPNSKGDMVMYAIVDPIWEVNFPNGSKINVTGTAEKIIDYINTHFPSYAWPDVNDTNISPSKKLAQDDPVPNCNVFTNAAYYLATTCHDIVKQLGNHFFNLGSGPGTCAQVECRSDMQGRCGAIWWCNDDLIGATVTANDIADLANEIISSCIEFDVPMSWTRGQIFKPDEGWNVIVDGGDPRATCRQR